MNAVLPSGTIGEHRAKKMFWNAEVGYKYKMSSMQAALGLAKLERIEELVERKRQIFRYYQENLQSVEGITLDCEPSGTKNSYWMVTAIFDLKFGLLKEDIIQMIKEKGIDSRPFFYPISSQPAYDSLASAREARGRNVVSYRVSPFGVNLPCGMNITCEIVNYVCDAVKKVVGVE